MADFFQPICDATLKYRDSKEVVIRKAVITLIPNMATFDPDRFEEFYLKNCMSYILQSLHKPTDRDIGMSPELTKLTNSLRRIGPYGDAIDWSDETLPGRCCQDYQRPSAAKRQKNGPIGRTDLSMSCYAHYSGWADAHQLDARGPRYHVPMGYQRCLVSCSHDYRQSHSTTASYHPESVLLMLHGIELIFRTPTR
jgi:hypothetical protein